MRERERERDEGNRDDRDRDTTIGRQTHANNPLLSLTYNCLDIHQVSLPKPTKLRPTAQIPEAEANILVLYDLVVEAFCRECRYDISTQFKSVE